MSTDGDALETVLAPLSVAEFMREQWTRHAVHIPGNPKKFEAIYDLEHWRQLRHIKDIDAATRDADGAQRQVRVERGQVPALLAAGMTICGDVSSAPELAEFLRRFQRRLGLGQGAAFAKLYVSPDGGGFPLHFDPYHVFVVQLSGTKRWKFSAAPAIVSATIGARRNPDGSVAYNFPRPDEPALADDGSPLTVPPLQSAELTPGDCLYLPPGTWHEARAVGSSIAVSISPPRQIRLGAVLNAIEAAVARDPRWREDLLTSGEQPWSDASQDLAGLAEIVRRLDPRRIDRTLRRELERTTARPGSASADAVIEPTDRLRHRSDEPLRYLVAPTDSGPDAIFFYGAGVEWELPIEARAFVEHLARTPRFSADDVRVWDPRLPWEDARDLLGELVSAGLLERDSSSE